MKSVAKSDKDFEKAVRVFKDRYAAYPDESWDGCCKRVAAAVCRTAPWIVDDIEKALQQQRFLPAGRFLANSGSHAGKRENMFSNCLALDIEDSAEGWVDALHTSFAALLQGCGVGINYSKVRPERSPISSGGYASGPLSVAHCINECGRVVNVGGARRSALMCSINWNHPDVMQFINAKLHRNASGTINHNYNFNVTNISIELDDSFFAAIEQNDTNAWSVYQSCIEAMLEYGEPGFLVNTGEYKHENLVNPCGEFRTEFSKSVCNLASVNLASVNVTEDIGAQVYQASYLAAMFLMAAMETCVMPVEGARVTNLGVGIMGFHTLLLRLGHPYAWSPTVEALFANYARGVEDGVAKYIGFEGLQSNHSKRIVTPMPVRTRAIAPTGTISQLTGIFGEIGSSGVEPIYSTAYIHRFYLNGKEHESTYVSPYALENPDIDDALKLGSTLDGVRQRLEMLAGIQRFVDQGISFTLNLPYNATTESFKHGLTSLFLEYLPKLRGLTVYRDGSRGVSPLQPISVAEAIKHNAISGTALQDCSSGVCGV